MVAHITGMQQNSNVLEERLYLGIKHAMSVGHKADFEHLNMFDFDLPAPLGAIAVLQVGT